MSFQVFQVLTYLSLSFFIFKVGRKEIILMILWYLYEDLYQESSKGENDLETNNICESMTLSSFSKWLEACQTPALTILF